MGFRVGKRVGNTYVSTNGRNVRTTTKIGKNTYYTHQFGGRKKARRRTTKSSDISDYKLLFDIIYFIVLWAVIPTSGFLPWWLICCFEGGMMGVSIKLKLMGLRGYYGIIKHGIIIIYLLSLVTII